MDEIICNFYGWVGDVSMLVNTTHDLSDPCNKCPDCGSLDIKDFE